MQNDYRIDGHKLIYHPDRVSRWLGASDWSEKKKIYPIYVEISPFGGCNHRCIFCALDYRGYKPISIDHKILINTLTEMAEKGVKSVMFAGEGEPLLYKGIETVLEHCRKVGIDSSLTTNFIPITPTKLEAAIKNCSWIKVSLNAGSPESYAKIHQTDKRDFEKAFSNLRDAIKKRDEIDSECTIGIQMLLLPENRHEAIKLAKRCRDIGADYLVIKPYSQHNFSETDHYSDIDYSDMLLMEEDLKKLNTDEFQVIFRSSTMKKHITKTQSYKTCYSTPYFWAYISSEADVYGCSAWLGDTRFSYGSLNKESFSNIWEGEKRARSINHIENSLNISECRINCRMDEINRYLWELKHPQPHVNFI